MTTAITLYGQPRCDPCRLARKVLDRAQVPATVAQMDAYFTGMRPQLRVDDAARAAARFILWPPMS